MLALGPDAGWVIPGGPSDSQLDLLDLPLSTVVFPQNPVVEPTLVEMVIVDVLALHPLRNAIRSDMSLLPAGIEGDVKVATE